VSSLLLLLAATRCSDEAPAAPREGAPREAAKPESATPQAATARLCDVTDDGPPWPVEPPPFDGEKFTWMRDALGAWRHDSSASPRYRMQEIITGGVALLDVDGDGDQDLFCNTGGAWPDAPPPATASQHALFRNDGGWRFTEIAAAAGVTLPAGGYAIGATAADFDGDGDDDLYVTGDRRSWLYRNDGVAEGAGGKVPRFVECAADLGVDAPGLLASSAAFLDGDRDGRLDLYVVGYVAFTDERNDRLRCGESTVGMLDYCSPKDFPGTQDRYFRQGEDGRFREMAREAGLIVPEPLAGNGKGLGVVACDVDDDGDVDLYVANDGCPNLLFVNDGAGRFAEKGMVRGCALSSDGRSQAGMGTDAGDFDGDGDVDLVVTNLDLETNALYRNDGAGFFEDDVRAAGLAAQDDGSVGFGALFLDVDHDGDLDLAIANGHVLRHVHRTRGTLTCWQHDQLFENDGRGRYRLLAPPEAGAFFLTRNVARGLAAGDLDGDGDLDLVLVRRDDGPVLLRNTHAERSGAADALLLTLVGAAGNRDAIGAVARLTVGGATQLRLVKGGGSYASASDRRLHFALPAAARDAKLHVRWPDGSEADLGPVEAGFAWRATQGRALEKLGPLTAR